MNGSGQVLPRWQSHKKVWASKIVKEETPAHEQSSDSNHRWHLSCGGIVEVSKELNARVPIDQYPVGGYYVQYEDGFESWSPSKAFEEGYLPLPTNTPGGDIENRFTYHAPKGNQPAKYEHLREQFKSLAYIINTICPDSREKSISMTKLEEAVFWANASIARNE